MKILSEARMNLQKYLDQLHIDITTAIKRGTTTGIENTIKGIVEASDWQEHSASHSIPLEKWCGIKKEQLPPEASLDTSQLAKLLDQLKILLETYHISVIFQLLVPKNIQYRVIRARFDQKVDYQKELNTFHFSFCDKPTNKKDCLLEEKYCHCTFYEHFFKRYSSQDEHSKPLDITIDADKEYLLKRRFGEDWYQYLRIDDEDFDREG